MTVRMEIDGAVAVLTLDRPQALNALDVSALRALRAHLAEVRDRDDLRAAVLTGAGTRAFCAGADLSSTRTSVASYPEALFRAPEQAADLGLYIRLMDLSDLGLWKPLIAAVNGHCLGAGLEIALQCDLRVASQAATFGLPEASVGSIPAVCGLHRLLRAVPSAHAMQMALTGERIDAEQALRIGLVTEAVTPEALLDRALTLATRVARNAPLAVQAIKKLSRQTPHLGESDAQQLTELYWGVLRDTADRLEGRQAFAEKRPPRYMGR
ncbi:Carnitinyl-CoA dehydratase [Cupriavidus yeoncheonensis]|uniref:Carnitinyl-CoA dehydratase n=1 Tax=Cupriavidus yeoncheonensis TaxID=1462994 RepID=A0A916IXL7_9BURK|nr:enoyl-CoA hydratase/isomerase family protein [Cupriavidus yeoncheonensis]CAG2152061.1 Carnitinyl-CoA dehydratase [Cupriavidus yeoncheonensis]